MCVLIRTITFDGGQLCPVIGNINKRHIVCDERMGSTVEIEIPECSLTS